MSKQAEARTNLKAIYAAQAEYFGKYHTHAATFDQLDARIEGWTRYAYYLSESEERMATAQPLIALPSYIKPGVSATGFTAAAAGNIDAEPTLDIWTINDRGELVNVVNDVKQ